MHKIVEFFKGLVRKIKARVQEFVRHETKDVEAVPSSVVGIMNAGYVAFMALGVGTVLSVFKNCVDYMIIPMIVFVPCGVVACVHCGFYIYALIKSWKTRREATRCV